MELEKVKTWKDACEYAKNKRYESTGDPDTCGFCKVAGVVYLGDDCIRNELNNCPLREKGPNVLCSIFLDMPTNRRRKIGEYVLANVKVFSACNIRKAIKDSGVLTKSELKVFNGEGE